MKSNELWVLDDLGRTQRDELDDETLSQAMSGLIRLTGRSYVTHQADYHRFGGRA
jgi:hypothetical protein